MKKRRFLALDGKNNGYMELRKGDFSLLSEDAHMTGIKVLEKEKYQKLF